MILVRTNHLYLRVGHHSMHLLAPNIKFSRASSCLARSHASLPLVLGTPFYFLLRVFSSVTTGASPYQSIHKICKTEINEFHIEVSEYTELYEI
jgi:hypothetical protein